MREGVLVCEDSVYVWFNGFCEVVLKTKLDWLCCPRCGGKTRTQVRAHTVLVDFPLFCPKCKYTCVIRFKDGKMEEIKMPDA